MTNAAYQVEREATLPEVLRHFLQTEATRPKYAGQQGAITEALALDDQKFFQWLSEFTKTRDDVNPVLTWTVGTQRNKNHEQVRRWVLAKVDLSVLYSSGINPTMKSDLNAVQGNLVRFSAFASKYPDFQMTKVPEGKQAVIIAVVRPCPGKVGTVEVVDGAHRVVAMAGMAKQNAEAFLGELRS